MQPPHRDLTVRETSPPLGPHQHPAKSLAVQGPWFPAVQGRWPAAVGGPRPPAGQVSKSGSVSHPCGRKARRRLCLLKGCERPFTPTCPQSRYCSDPCREAARRWRAWQAQQRYRATERGKTCRCDQCRRYRERVRERQQAQVGTVEQAVADEPAITDGREGKRPADSSKKNACSRPGCYELFHTHPRSPLQKFCSPLCRRALRRVLVREARWRRQERTSARTRPDVRHHPP